MGFYERFLLKLRVTSPHSWRIRASARITIWRQWIFKRRFVHFEAIWEPATDQASTILNSRLATAIREHTSDQTPGRECFFAYISGCSTPGFDHIFSTFEWYELWNEFPSLAW